ncbi:MAG: hypothetical protein M3463_07985 [Verrucomicrobiota bacterium]|nr:hypothetical protein [Verrucomicrobiota bacterium]
MDPKGIGEINRLYKDGDILTRGVHKFAPTAAHIQGGLSNEDFFAEFGSELLVLNGVDYSVNNHSPGARYMATGKLDSLAYPTFAALVAACKGPGCPLSFLTGLYEVRVCNAQLVLEVRGRVGDGLHARFFIDRHGDDRRVAPGGQRSRPGRPVLERHLLVNHQHSFILASNSGSRFSR